MKAQFWTISAAALCALPLCTTACSGSGEVITSGREASVTLRGVGTSGVTSLSLPLSDVTANVDGKSVTVRDVPGTLNLVGGEDQVVARFAVPSPANNALVTIRFDDYGGFESASSSGAVDARGKVLTVALPACALGSGSSAMSLDVAGSLSPKANGDWVLEPHLTAAY